MCTTGKPWTGRIRTTLATVLSAGLLVGAVAGTAGAAEDYPAKPVHVVVPFSAGGPNDLLARPVAQALSQSLGQNFLVENKPGASGVVGSAAVANSKPDGYTMLVTTGSFSANAVLHENLPYDPLKDFRPVAQIAESYGLVLVSRPEFEAQDLEELIALMKENPGEYTYATSGTGNATHVAGEVFKKAVGVDMLAVPYQGSAGGLVDVLSGKVDFAFFSTTIAVPQVTSGKLKAYASTGNERVPALSDIPTMKEKGYDDVVVTGYYGMWFPAGTPDDIVTKVQNEVAKAIETPEVAGFIKNTNLKAVGSTSQEFEDFLAKDIQWQRDMMKLTGLDKKS